MEIHDGVLAFRLLNSANLSDSNNLLIKATLTEMKYSLMKDQLNKVFASTSVSVQPKAEVPVKFDPVTCKIEPVDTYYSRSASSTKRSQAQGYTYRSRPSSIFDNEEEFADMPFETYYGSFRGRGRSTHGRI